MFHPGKVIDVFSPKSRNVDSCNESTQAMVNMWDENLFTFNVDQGISDKISIDDIVLVDYSPAAQGSPVPKRVITKILKGSSGKKIWSQYKAFYEKKRAVKMSKNKSSMKMPVEEHSYMG